MPVIELLDLSGDAHQRGATHGEALRDRIVSGIERWRDQMAAVQPLGPDAFIEHVHASTGFVDAANRHAPDLLAEVRGIAAGANLDFATVFAFQLLDECWWLTPPLAQGSESRGCSGLATHRAEGGCLAAQTMDLPLHYDGGQVLLRFTDPSTGIRQLILTAAGLVGLNGMNDTPLAVCVNTLSELPCSRRGLPVAFVARSLLNAPDLAGAVECVETTPHASGQNYLLVSPDGFVDIEAGAESTTRYPGAGGGQYVYHTNHVLAGPLAGNRPAATDENSIAGPNSSHRFEALAGFFDHDAQPGLDDVKTLLAREPIRMPRREGHGFTFGASIMILGDAPSLHVTHGPPTATNFVEHAF